MKKIIKVLIPVIVLLPLAAGTIGYLDSGEMVTNALYASFALYFTNPVSDAYNGWVEFARWTAPLVTATAILSMLKTVWESLKWRMHLLGKKDSVAVYSDEDIRIAFSPETRAIYPGEKFKAYAGEHIILFSSDRKSLQFYEEHREKTAKKGVYIGLRDLELGSLKEMKNVTLFDVNGSVARLLWKKIALWNGKSGNRRIVIYGNNTLAQEILATGLQVNLYSLQQKVEYHVVSDTPYFKEKYQKLPLMNSDEILCHSPEEDMVWDLMASADAVIVTEQAAPGWLQMIAARAEDSHVYYYSPEEGDIMEYLAIGHLVPFGRNAEVLTDGNIRRQELIRRAIALNGQYAEKYHGEKDWNSLPGFLKASNISSADYGEVIADMPEDIPEETLAQLEHIRWCRFHYLYHWKYGVPENGAGKDPVRRIHKDLVPYEELNDTEKEKDLETIRMWRKNNI